MSLLRNGAKSTNQQQQNGSCPFHSNIKAWCFAPRENDITDTTISAVPLGRFANTTESIWFKSKNCYLILHLYHHHHHNSNSSKDHQQQKREIVKQQESQNGNSLFRVAMSTAELLTPRGLEHRFSTGESNTFGFTSIDGKSQKWNKLNGSSSGGGMKGISYDLYLWHGKQSNPSTQAVAITRGYELERSLLDSQTLETIFFAGQPESIGQYFSCEDMPTMANGSPDGKLPAAFVSLYQNNHLFRVLANIVESDAMSKSAPSSLTSDSSSPSSREPFGLESDVSTIRSLLQLPSLKDSSLAFPTNANPAPEYQASPMASPRDPLSSPRHRQRIIPNLNLGTSGSISGQSSLSLSSRSSDRKRRNPAIPRIGKLQMSPRKRSSDGLFDIFSEPKKMTLTPRSTSSRGDSSSRSYNDGSSSRFSIDLSSMDRPRDVSDPSPTPRRIQSRLNSIINRPMSGAELVVYYRRVCSKVYDGVYVGGDTVARDKSLLQANGITHVINAALVACDIYFPDSFEYLAFSLYDAGSQSILGSFFATIDFIEKARKNGGNVFVHCYEGVSRSSTLAISYIMWRTRQTYNSVLEDVKTKRAVCSPNAGFIVQLLQWEKMLREPQTYLFRAAPLNDRYAEHRQVVPKLCNSDVLDTRTSFMLYSPEMQMVFIWDGSQTQNALRQALESFSDLFVKYFTDSKAKLVNLTEQEAKTHDDFQSALSSVAIDTRYSIKTTHYDDLDYLSQVDDDDSNGSDKGLGGAGDAAETSGNNANDSLTYRSSKRSVHNNNNNNNNNNNGIGGGGSETVEDEEDEDLVDVKPGELFIFDGGWDSIDNFNADDLLPDYYYVLRPEDLGHVYVWVGSEVDMGDQSLESFGQAKAQEFFEHSDMDPMEVRIMMQDKESSDFDEYFFNPHEGIDDDDYDVDDDTSSVMDEEEDHASSSGEDA